MGEVGALPRIEFSSVYGVLYLSTSFIGRFNLRRRFASGAASMDGASAGDGTLCGLRSRGPMPANRQLLRPDIVRSGASRRWYALPRLALLRADRGVGVFQQPVRTLALEPLNLGWGRQCNRFRSGLDDLGSVASVRREHRSDVLNRRL
jgi:hypothetical protein